MGLLDGLFGGGDDEVKYTPTPLDQGGQGLINAQFDRSQDSTQNAIARRTANIDQTPELMGGGNDAASLGMHGTEGLSRAIMNRQKQRRGEGITKLKTGAELAGFDDRFKDLETAKNSQLAAQKIKNRNNEMVWKAQAANVEARGAILRNLLGVGGTIAGAIVAGPAGAIAGSQLGGKGQDMDAFLPEKSKPNHLGVDTTMPKWGEGDGGF